MKAGIILRNKKNYNGEMIADIVVKSKKILSVPIVKKMNSSAIDEFLVIFLIAAKAKGISSFKDLSELNKKESPRLDIAVKFLKMIAVKVERNKTILKFTEIQI